MAEPARKLKPQRDPLLVRQKADATIEHLETREAVRWARRQLAWQGVLERLLEDSPEAKGEEAPG